MLKTFMTQTHTVSQDIGLVDSAEAMTLAESARWISKTAGVPEPHISTLHRWATHGVRGVRLQTTRVGARFWTTAASLAEFLDALNGGKEYRPAHEPKWETVSFSQDVRRAQIEAACIDIDRICGGVE